MQDNTGHIVRTLMRGARAGTLATSADGQPYAALVTPAMMPDGDVLVLLSGLSDHTKQLLQNPRCALMVCGPATGANPQTSPRLTLIGTASPDPDPALRVRWLALHPYAAFYAGLEDFRIWRIEPREGRYIGGFGQARRIASAALRPPLDAVQALSAAEARIVSHCNQDHGAALNRIAQRQGGDGEGWRMVTCDPDGFDLARSEQVIRVPFATVASSPADVRAALVALAQQNPDPIKLDKPGAGPGQGRDV